ncbi:MAG: AAA family ATPase, partial [Humibacillus sp.]|nr:AAA family ATPase [Humibacillus sp.]
MSDDWPDDTGEAPPLDPWPDEAMVDDEYERQLAFNRSVSEAADKIRVSEAARERIAAEKSAANPAPPFDSGTLREVLARPAAPPMRVEGLMPWASGTLLVAQRKTGKTTLMLNYARSLLHDEPLLGRFAVRPVEGIVSVLNYEVSGEMLGRWADEHGIDRDRLYLVNLRGRRNPLSHPEDRQRLADDLRSRGTEALIVDPFGRAYTGTSQNDPGEVGSWLVDLDLFARSEVGASELMLTAHAGWNGERTRGSTALEDWADSIITMTRDQDDETKRFLRAIGRDVELDEDRLDFNPDTRTLTLAGVGSRKQSRDTEKLADLAVFVVRAAREHPGAGVAGIERLIKGMDDAPTFRSGEVSKAAKHARELGHLHIVSNGPGTPSHHFAIDLTSGTPPNPSQTPPR